VMTGKGMLAPSACLKNLCRWMNDRLIRSQRASCAFSLSVGRGWAIICRSGCWKRVDSRETRAATLRGKTS
jgi:hypothetical protein